MARRTRSTIAGFTVNRGGNTISLSSGQQGWSRGFVKLWQFRTSDDNTQISPENRGPCWRDPPLARLEAVLFLAREPLNSRKIAQLASLADGTLARTLIRRLNRHYEVGGQSFRVVEIAGGYQLMTHRRFAAGLRRLVQNSTDQRLSAPAMETLAVVAYRQPILRTQVETIRGVQCDDILRQLLERDLVRIVGRSEDLGRPRLYGTTKRFLELFGLRDLDELPRAAEFRLSSPRALPSEPSIEQPQQTSSNRIPGVGRIENITLTEPHAEENSVTTRTCSLSSPDDLVDESLGLFAQAAPDRLEFGSPDAAKRQDNGEEVAEDEEGPEDDDEDEDWDDDDEEEDDDDEEDDEEEDDDFVDEEWEEVDDDEEEDDEDEEEEEDDDWDDDDDEWDDDDEEEEEESKDEE